MKLDELTPKARARVLRAIARGEVAAAGQSPAPGGGVKGSAAARPIRPGSGGRWSCIRCPGSTWTAYAPAQRHVDAEHRAGRIEWHDR